MPNARPALDCPVVYPYAPNAVLIGFLFSFLGGIVGLFICGQFSWVLILPGWCRISSPAQRRAYLVTPPADVAGDDWRLC